MHIPDGFLDTRVLATMDLVSFPGIAFLARRAQKTFHHNKIPLMGVMGAFIFAAQMINFPVGNGTSGHLVGGALLSYALGPAAASIVLTAILLTQAFIFQDGGILALGANIFNMAIAGVIMGYLPYRLLNGHRAGVFAGGFLSVITSASLALAELAASHVAMPRPLLTASLLLFAASAAIEGAITLVVVQALSRIDHRVLASPPGFRSRGPLALVCGSVFLAVVGILFASTHPDGLQSLVTQLGISNRTRSLFIAPFADYKVNFMPSDWLNHALAGIAGLFAVYVICLLAARLLSMRRALACGASRDEA